VKDVLIIAGGLDARDRIIKYVAERECERIARKTVRSLQRMTDGMQSGDDSGLASVWDEMCVQVQGDQSGLWDHYVGLAGSLIEQELRALKSELNDAVWLQTREGSEWDPEEDPEISYNTDLVVDYILNDFVLELASNWTNRRIERFNSRGYGLD